MENELNLQVLEKQIPSQGYVYIDAIPRMTELSETFSRIYGKLTNYLKQHGQEVTVTMAYYWGPPAGGVLPLRAGVPVNKKLDEFEDIKYFEIPAGKVAFTEYRGTYDKLTKAHETVANYCKKKGYKVTVSWEIYLADCSNEPDSSKWITEVAFPI